jgi:RNA polymerase sigma-70 factor (ECF subfamily)
MRLFSRSSRDEERTGEKSVVEDGTISGGDDVDLFGRLVQDHRDKLFRVAYRMTGHTEEAQDLLQDALVEAYRSFRHFRRGTYFAKWLYRIMTNTFIDRQRRRKRVGSVLSLDSPTENPDTTLDIADWQSNPENLHLRDKFDEPLQRALDDLPAEFSMVLVLADVESFSYEEIGEMMNTPVGTVRSRLHRARSTVRKHLTDAGYGRN